MDDVADGALDDVHDGRVENPKVRLVQVEAFVQEQGQFIGEHPERSGFVHFQIVREFQSLAVRRHQMIGIRGIFAGVPVRVPAPDAILVHLGVEQHAGVLVQRRPAGLGVRAAGPEHLVLVIAVRRDAGVLHDPGGHAKLPGAGQRVEVQRPVPVLLVDRPQGHAEYPVGPLEVVAAHVEVTGQRVEVEVMVLDAPRGVGRETVHDQPVTAQVGYVSVGVRARLLGGVGQDVGEERVGFHVVRFERVLPDQRVGVQVEHHQLRRLHLIGLAPDVVQPGVHQPQPVAHVHANPEHGHDAVRRVGRQTVLLVLGIRYQAGRSVFRVWKLRGGFFTTHPKSDKCNIVFRGEPCFGML